MNVTDSPKISYDERLSMLLARLPRNQYLEWLAGLETIDLDSRIIIEIVVDDTHGLANTIKSAMTQAAAPGRIYFAVSLPEHGGADAFRHVPEGHARTVRYSDRNPCRARLDLQDLYDMKEKEFVLYTQADTRFAFGWDVASIGQYQLCENRQTVLSMIPVNDASLLSEPTESAIYTKRACRSTSIGVSRFLDDTCVPQISASSESWDPESPSRGAFVSLGYAFGPSDLDTVSFDPYMWPEACAVQQSVKYYTAGWGVMHPPFMYVFDVTQPKNKMIGKNPPVLLPDGTNYETRQVQYAEDFFTVPGCAPSECQVKYFEQFAGVDFKNRLIRRHAADGFFTKKPGAYGESDLEYVNWRQDETNPKSHTHTSLYFDENVKSRLDAENVLPSDAAAAAIRKFVSAKRTAFAGDADTRFRFAVKRMYEAQPRNDYVTYLDRNLQHPNLINTVRVEIASADPEALKDTIRCARAMAANPDRVHFAVAAYVPDDAGPDGTARFLDLVPHCKYQITAGKTVPNYYEALAKAQALSDGEAYALRCHDASRFAYGWDAVLIHELGSCGDTAKDKILTHQQVWPFKSHDLLGPEYSNNIKLQAMPILPDYFKDFTCRLHVTTAPTVPGDGPLNGAFLSSCMMFASGEALDRVAIDPDMDFDQLEQDIAVRAWTNGIDIWHPFVCPVWALDRRPWPKNGPDKDCTGTSRFMELVSIPGRYDRYGLAPGTKFGTGTVQPVSAYQEYSGVDFMNMSVRFYGNNGHFGRAGEDSRDMLFVQWFGNKTTATGAPAHSEIKNCSIPTGLMHDLKALSDLIGTPWQVLLNQAMDEWLS